VRDRTKSDAAQEAGFERLFQEHWGRVVGVLFRLVGDPDEAEDLALETFWRLHCRPPAELEALNGEPVPAEQRLGGWLYRVATRLGYNALRARRRRQRYEEEAGRLALEEDRPPTPDQALELAEQRQCVQRILAELPPRQAQVLVLRHSGLSYSEIAAALGVAACKTARPARGRPRRCEGAPDWSAHSLTPWPHKVLKKAGRPVRRGGNWMFMSKERSKSLCLKNCSHVVFARPG
jgi:RNA polymerase sigma-70 factor (ECF subfamily)